jgi:HlyD family secretion protein
LAEFPRSQLPAAASHRPRRWPHGADDVIKAVVTELRPLGVFATWQAERVIGDHDRNTLRLRLDPQRASADLEPGMTVWIEH